MDQMKSCTIKEAARLLGVEPSTLRYWEEIGLISSTRNPASNYRMYSLHNLFEASDVAFFRKMGMSVKTMQKSRDYSLEDLIDALDVTHEGVERKIEHLRVISQKLEDQRKVASHALDLMKRGIREATPTAKRLVAYDPALERQWDILVSDLRRYAVLVDAEEPDVLREACADFPGSEDAYGSEEPIEVIWDRKRELQRGVRFFEGVALSEHNRMVDIDMRSLFDAARDHGHTPLYAIAHYLVSANFSGRKDCYRVLIACAPVDAS